MDVSSPQGIIASSWSICFVVDLHFVYAQKQITFLCSWFRASSHELILVHWPAFWTDILLSFQPSSTQGLCDIIPLVHLAKFLLVGEPGSAIDQQKCYWKRIWPFPNRVLTKWCTWIATFLHRCWAKYHRWILKCISDKGITHSVRDLKFTPFI